MHVTKACGEVEEYRHLFLKSTQNGASVLSAIRPGRPSPNEEAPAYPFDRKVRGLQCLS